MKKILVFALFIFLTSNSFSQINKNLTRVKSIQKTNEYETLAKNSKNPYNYIGEFHNQILDDVISNYKIHKMDRNEVMDFIKKRVIEKYPKTVISYNKENSKELEEYFKNPYKTLYDKRIIGYKDYYYLNQIEMAMACCPEDVLDKFNKILEDILKGSPTFPEPYNYGKDVNNPYADIKDSNDGTFALITLAIAENSFKYWKKQNENPNSLWKKIIKDKNYQLAGPGDNIGGADAAGAGGAALVTWWTGPFCPATVVVSGVGSSLGVAVWESAKWLWGAW
ncbi:hypothetical protein [Lutibacter sp.]|uniref:hypothetical protein n=1 Tax=Lutibacter sp. TaxID=1925666 RepID=UPI003564D5B6